jgi:hypothetical protein
MVDLRVVLTVRNSLWWSALFAVGPPEPMTATSRTVFETA